MQPFSPFCSPLFEGYKEEEVFVVGCYMPLAVAEADEAAVLVSPPSALLGSMWVHHPKHGLVRRSAGIAAHNTGSPILRTM